MATFGEYLQQGEQSLIGKTFSSGGNTPYIIQVKAFYSHPDTNERHISVNIEQRGRLIHFGAGGKVENWLNQEEVLFIPGDPQ